jgi:hypothetical protein
VRVVALDVTVHCHAAARLAGSVINENATYTRVPGHTTAQEVTTYPL